MPLRSGTCHIAITAAHYIGAGGAAASQSGSNQSYLAGSKLFELASETAVAIKLGYGRRKPDPPEGYRELPIGEPIRPGDLQWLENKWCTITAVEKLSVGEEGRYCRKI